MWTFIRQHHHRSSIVQVNVMKAEKMKQGENRWSHEKVTRNNGITKLPVTLHGASFNIHHVPLSALD